MGNRRHRFLIQGVVQGIGFRPHLFRLATEMGLAGFVRNQSGSVLAEVEGTIEQLRQFEERMKSEIPPLGQIVDVQRDEISTLNEKDFVILPSWGGDDSPSLVPPDVATCPECFREVFDPSDRRYHYPFTNCTNCGPRFTIVQSLPYDRPRTSMAEFPMCSVCSSEYSQPLDRRFHAQPNACPTCGPRLWLTDAEGVLLSDCGDPLAQVQRLLEEGAILGLRGLGGFHLVVDPRRAASVAELKRRKGRAEKPLALMAPNLDCIARFCHLSQLERQQLSSPARPIVLLKARKGCALTDVVAPRQNYLGFMLPYTPLHHLLLGKRFEALVMTSGNWSEEPIVTSNDEALDRLSGIVDYFLLHDREILQRCDDSIVRVLEGKPRLIRRARGFVPLPIRLKEATRFRILACGAELKSTAGFSKGKNVFLTQHIGDLNSLTALRFFESSVSHFSGLLEFEPEALAYDLHPDYLSTQWALGQEGVQRVGVQHHHAHLASVMAENQVSETCIGIILDGTGYGLDGTSWGGEVLLGDLADFMRFAWLHPIPLPGGDLATREPWRTAVSALDMAFGEELCEVDLPFLKSLSATQLNTILRMIQRGINSPLSSSAGRLFDAVAAVLGVRSHVSYEAQAAIELEMMLDQKEHGFYSAAVEKSPERGALSTAPLVRAIVEDVQRREPLGKISARFHWTLAELFIKSALSAREASGVGRVALSGGVFQNVAFFKYLNRRLVQESFQVLTHSLVPTNDGGIALGQAVVADAVLSLLSAGKQGGRR